MIEQCSVAVGLKLVAVDVIEEFYAVFGHDVTRPVKDGNRLAASLFIKRVAMRNPGAAGISQPKRFGLAGDSFRVVSVLIDFASGIP